MVFKCKCGQLTGSSIHKDGWEVVNVPHCEHCVPKKESSLLDKLRAHVAQWQRQEL